MASSILDILDRPLIWNLSRIGLDLAFGLYSKRARLLRESGLIGENTSVLDVGCGIGQYALITKGRYLGMDMNERYIAYAKKRHSSATDKLSFRCGDVTRLIDEGEQFDIVLMVDFLHHIPDGDVIKLLHTASRLATRAVISLEPVTEQNNPLGAWFIRNDRGMYMRSTDSLFALFNNSASGLNSLRSQPLQLGPISTYAIFAQSAH